MLPMNLFFDLFFTLCTPCQEGVCTEWDALGIPQAEWLSKVETEELCAMRDLGIHCTTPEEMMQDVLARTGLSFSPNEAQRLTDIRICRMRRAITEIDPVILAVLDVLRAQGHKLCLVSNADIIDTLHRAESPLASRPDAVVFSHAVHVRKPQPDIYRIALQRLQAQPKDSIFIGDGGSDEHMGAKNAGMTTILVTHLRPRSEEELSVLSAYVDHVTADFAQLPALVQRR